MKIKLFLSVTTIMLAALGLSFSAEADPVPWTTETYTAYAKAQECCVYPVNEETVSGPPLPISAYVSYDDGYGGFGEAGSTITSSTIDVGAIGYRQSGIHSTSYGIFSGTYRAYDPLFLFSYDYAGTAYYVLYIQVEDLTDASIIYSQSYGSSSDVIYIPVAIDHDIGVSFGVHMPGGTETATGRSESASLTYSMAVAPEPLSSILFITGGLAFAVRRRHYRRQLNPRNQAKISYLVRLKRAG